MDRGDRVEDRSTGRCGILRWHGNDFSGVMLDGHTVPTVLHNGLLRLVDDGSG